MNAHSESADAETGSARDADARRCVAVERAIGELRAGRPVLLRHGRARYLVSGIEALDSLAAAAFESLGSGQAALVLTAARLRRLGQERDAPGSIRLPRLDPARIARLATDPEARIDAPVAPAAPGAVAALELVGLALLLPAVVLARARLRDARVAGVLGVSTQDLAAWQRQRIAALRIVGRAPVPLSAGDTEFVVFRGGDGLRDQVAVIVGKPDLSGTVAVRLHSACLTGDLFGSLKCDCGDQLRGALALMADGGGGILLYLDQEGRGNGIGNKIRAYGLQARGLDTFDADEVLGFAHDQRAYDYAAAMLRLLGVKRVALMTNNPVKIASLEAAGLAVVSDQRILGRRTAQNVAYLATKRDKAGHLLEQDGAPSRVDD